jgi:hypothetical protein
MSNKRYGGKFQFSGGGNSWVALIGFVLLVGFTLAALLFNRPWLIVPGFLLLFILGGISTLVSGGQLSAVKKQIFQDRVNAAILEYENGNYTEAARLFEIAARHSALSEREEEIYRKCKGLANA